MFKFLNLINLDFPILINHLESHGFSDNDDIMRILDVDTTGLHDYAKSQIDSIKKKSKSNPSDNVPRIFLEEIMYFFEHAKNNFESTEKEYEIMDKAYHISKNELDEKKLELDKCTLELNKTKQQAKEFVAVLMKKT